MSLEIGDDNLIARSVQGVYTPSVQPILAPPVNKDWYQSTIAPVESSQKTHIMLRILDAHAESERLNNIKAEQFEVESKATLAEIEQVNAKKEEAFRQEAEATKYRDSWSTLANVSQYIASVGSIAMSFAVGGVPGMLLAASGIAGGVTRLLHDTAFLQPALDWWTDGSAELEKSLRDQMDTATTTLQVGLAVAGGFGAWHAGTFAGLQTADYLTKGASVLSATGTVMNGGSQVGKLYYDKRKNDLQANMRELELEATLGHHTLTTKTKDISEMLETNDSSANTIKKGIKKLEVEIG